MRQTKIVSFGTLYIGDESQEPWPTARYDGEQPISIGDTIPMKEIKWVAHNGIFVALDPILVFVNHQDLARQGLVDGKPISIDGIRYHVSLPQIGESLLMFQNSPWRKFIKEVQKPGKSYFIDHPYEKSWGREIVPPGCAAVVGGASISEWDVCPAHVRSSSIGWRPWLEPDMPTDEELNAYQIITVFFGGQYQVTGMIVDATPYDIVLCCDERFVIDTPGQIVMQSGNELTINRESIQRILFRAI